MVRPRDCAAFFAVLLVALGTAAGTPLFAQAVPSVELWMTAGAEVSSGGLDGGPEYSSAGARLLVDSARSGTVRGSLAVSIQTDGTVFLERAWLRARFPWITEDSFLRFSAGKMPLSWGRGFFFNAADPVFGELPSIRSAGAGEYRISTDWMAVVLLPLGSFSFLEIAALPEITADRFFSGTGEYLSGAAAGSAVAAGLLPPPPGNRAGTRVALTPGWYLLHSIEANWLYSENTGSRFGLAGEGSLWFDWYASASADDDAQNWSVSAGIFRAFDWFRDVPISFRSELLTHPGRENLVCFAVLQAGFADIYSLSLQGLYAAGGRPVHSSLPHGSGLAAVALSIVPLSGFSIETSLSHLRGGEGSGLWIISAGTRLRY